MPRFFVSIQLQLVFVLCFGLSCVEAGFPGSEQVQKPKPPLVSVSAIRLAEVPTATKVATYICAEKFGSVACSLLGKRPSLSDLRTAFDVELQFQNPNSIPLPLVNALFAFDAFPEQKDANKLGTLCMTFCENPNSCTQSANACESDEPEIKDINDFANATKNFLISMARGDAALDNLRVRTIAPGDRLAMVVRLGLEPTQVVNLLRQAGQADWARLKTGKVPDFSIPYSLQGTAWVSIPNFGRLAAPFGPTQGEFELTK